MELTPIQKKQVLHNKVNINDKKTYHLYFAMKKDASFAYLLLDERGIIEQNRILENKEVVGSPHAVFRVLVCLLKITKKHQVKKLVIHTHHRDYLQAFNKLNPKFEGEKATKLKQKYPEMVDLIHQFDTFEYKYVKRANNKLAVTLLKEGEQEKQKHTFVAYVDASSQHQKKESSIAGVLKTSLGETKLTFAKNCTYSHNSEEIEMYAVLEMMKRATKDDFTPVTIYTDNQTVHDHYKGKIKRTDKNQQVYRLMQQAKKEYTSCTVKKISRQYNTEAHDLALNSNETCLMNG